MNTFLCIFVIFAAVVTVIIIISDANDSAQNENK